MSSPGTREIEAALAQEQADRREQERYGQSGRCEDDYFDNLGGSGSTSQFTETILAGAGLTVHGAGYLSYPGEGLVKDGLSYVANAVHNI